MPNTHVLKSWWERLGPYLPLALRVILGLLFLYTGVQKAVSLTDTVLAVHGYALAPGILVHPIALGLTLLEIVLGILLLVGLTTRFAAVSVAVLTVVFLGVLIQAKARGLDIGCGCFGGNGTGKGESWLDILRDVPLLAAAVYLAWRVPGPFALDGRLHGLGSERELKIAVPFVLVGGIVVAAFAVSGLSGALNLPQAAAPEQVNVSAPARTTSLPVGSVVPSFKAPELYGGTISWGTYAGTPVVLVIWAPWCPECRAQVPVVARVASGFSKVRLVSIVTAAGELPGPTPEDFMESHHLAFPVALDSSDEKLADAFGVEGYPTIYYVRADGTVSQETTGVTSEAAVRAAIVAIAK